MENSPISSHLTNYLPPLKELTFRTVTYGATSLLLGRVDPVVLFISTFNAVTVSFAAQFSKKEDKDLKKGIIALVSLAASTFIAVKAAPALVGRATLAFAQDIAWKLFLFNTIGETALFSLPYFAKWDAPKLPETVDDLDKLTEKNFLYMRNHFAGYAAMSTEVFLHFTDKLLKLEKPDLFPNPPETAQDIQNLDAFSIRLMHAHPDYMNLKNAKIEITSPLWEALYLRFIDEGLTLPLDDFDKHTSKTLLHIRDNFEKYTSMDSKTFGSFVKKLETLGQEDIFPKPPKSVEEIEQLDPFAVRYAHAFPDEMNTEISAMKSDTKPLWEALHTRFFEQDLSLPRGDTIENVIKVNKGYYHIKIDPLPSLEQVQGFSINKLSWLYCQIGVKFEVFATYSINDQIALNKIFDEKFKSTWHYSPTMANIADLSDESAKELDAYYSQIIAKENHRFLCLPMDVKNALNERLTKLTLRLASFGTTYKIPDIEDFKKPQVATTWHEYFTNNPAEWAKVDKARQEAFNNLFKGKKLAEIAITHKD